MLDVGCSPVNSAIPPYSFAAEHTESCVVRPEVGRSGTSAASMGSDSSKKGIPLWHGTLAIER